MNEYIYEMTKDFELTEFMEYRKQLKDKTRMLKGRDDNSCPFDIEGEENYGE